MSSLLRVLFLLSIGVFVSTASASSNDGQIVNVANRKSIDLADHIRSDEVDQIRMRVEQMSDYELVDVFSSIFPQQRTKRTIGGTFTRIRNCVQKVRCLFGPEKRHKRQASSASSILRAISKLTSIASDAAKELLGTSDSSSSAPASVSLAEDLASSFEGEDTETAASSSGATVGLTSGEKKNCEQRCILSGDSFKTLRRLFGK